MVEVNYLLLKGILVNMAILSMFQYHFPGAEFLTFEHITLVPYEPKLIEVSLLSDKQVISCDNNLVLSEIFISSMRIFILHMLNITKMRVVKFSEKSVPSQRYDAY